jgi:anionic cell wall polymer biosynthesis LytR-Cps2A-Psr (LCP) family protein
VPLRSQLRKPLATAALSAIFPGLGQAAAGDPRRGAIVAIPAIAVLGAFGVILVFSRGSLFGLALDQGWLTSLLILDVVALIYHVWAVVDAYLLASSAQPRRRRSTSAPGNKWTTVLGVGVILSGTVAVHGGVAKVDTDWQHALYCLTATTPCWVTDNPAPDSSAPVAYASGDNVDAPIDTPSTGPIASGSAAPATTFNLSALPSFETADSAQNWAADGQLNVLLIGADYEAGTSRATAWVRPDTMIVLHVDLASGRAAMIGVPRNNVCVPLPSEAAVHYATARNGCSPYTWSGRGSSASGQLNWLAMEATQHPENFPSYPQDAAHAWYRGELATEQAVATLTGLTIDGFMTINLSGLSTLIDDLGGIDINVPTRVYDQPCGPKGTWAAAWYVCAAPIYSGYNVPGDFGNVQRMIDDAAKSGGLQSITWHGSTSVDGTDIAFVIKPGQQHMDGNWTLAYARSRKFSPGGDFGRMQRQQLVLKAMRTTFDPCKILPSVPGLIQHVGNGFNTNLPLSALPQWARIGQRILGGSVKTIVLDPTSMGESFINTYPAIDATSWAKIKDTVAHSLDSVPTATGSPGDAGAAGGFSC